MPSRNKVVVGEPAAGEIVIFFAFAVSGYYKKFGEGVTFKRKNAFNGLLGIKNSEDARFAKTKMLVLYKLRILGILVTKVKNL